MSTNDPTWNAKVEEMRKNPVEELLDPVWERQPGETTLWYGRFQEFLQMGNGRTLRAVYRSHLATNRPTAAIGPIKDLPPHWKAIISHWRWMDRVKAWDLHLEREAQALWKKRQLDVREQEYAVAEKMLHHAERVVNKFDSDPDMLESADTLDLQRLAETGSKLARLSTGLATERKEVEEQAPRASATELARRLVEDPNAAALVGQLLTGFANSITGGDGLGNIGGEVDTVPAPPVPVTEAG